MGLGTYGIVVVANLALVALSLRVLWQLVRLSVLRTGRLSLPLGSQTFVIVLALVGSVLEEVLHILLLAHHTGLRVTREGFYLTTTIADAAAKMSHFACILVLSLRCAESHSRPPSRCPSCRRCTCACTAGCAWQVGRDL